MTKFEERLWSLIRNFVELGHNNPAMLVAAVRIVEIQEMVDKQLESSGQGKYTLLYVFMPACHCRLTTMLHNLRRASWYCTFSGLLSLSFPSVRCQPCDEWLLWPVWQHSTTRPN